MTQNLYPRLGLSFVLATILAAGFPFTQAQAKNRDANQSQWRTAYFAAWQEPSVPLADIDFSALSHVVHFSLVPRADGSIDKTANGSPSATASKLIASAHAGGAKVLISIGGWSTASGFRGATDPSHLSRFVSNLVSFARLNGYDGIDIDWEPLADSDETRFVALIKSLRVALDQQKSGLLLTSAVASAERAVAKVSSELDQINIMTYDLSGTWLGATAHNSPVYSGSITDKWGNQVDSIDSMVKRFVTAGVPAKKLGVGIDFYGYVWRGGAGTSSGGVSEPGQVFSSAPSVQVNVSYADILRSYSQGANLKWDQAAQAKYLSRDLPGSSNDMFISFDDAQSIVAKASYAKSHGLGGVFIWEIGGGYMRERPKDSRNPLLTVLKAIPQ